MNLVIFFQTCLHYGTVCGLILSKLWSALRFACVTDVGCECFLNQFMAKKTLPNGTALSRASRPSIKNGGFRGRRIRILAVIGGFFRERTAAKVTTG